jgi:hypothetical protein
VRVWGGGSVGPLQGLQGPLAEHVRRLLQGDASEPNLQARPLTARLDRPF